MTALTPEQQIQLIAPVTMEQLQAPVKRKAGPAPTLQQDAPMNQFVIDPANTQALFAILQQLDESANGPAVKK